MIPLHVLVQRVVEDTDIDLGTVNMVIRSFMHHMREAMVRDGIVRLDGIGKLSVVQTAQNGRRNLMQGRWKTKVATDLMHQYRVFFKKAPTLSALLRAEHGGRHARKRRRDHGEVGRR